MRLYHRPAGQRFTGKTINLSDLRSHNILSELVPQFFLKNQQKIWVLLCEHKFVTIVAWQTVLRSVLTERLTCF